MKASDYIKEWSKLKTTRTTWDQTYQKLSDFVSPTPRNIVGQSSMGGRKKAMVLDTTATDVAVQLGHALNSAATNPLSDWFRLTIDDYDLAVDRDAKLWLDVVADRTNHYLKQSNFAESMSEVYLDLIIYGTVGLLVEEDDEDGFYFSARNIGEFVISENHKGKPDRVLRKAIMTARQAAMKFGKLPRSIDAKYQEDPEALVNILHIIEPRNERNPDKIDKKNKPIRSIWVSMDDDEVIDESGYDEMPFIVARWAKNAGDTYGYSPAMQCINAILALNLIEKTSLEAKQLAARPPLFFSDDSQVSKFQYREGSVTYLRRNSDKPYALDTKSQPNAADSAAEDRRKLIQSTFFNDLINKELKYVTAEGVRDARNERDHTLTSAMGRIQSELLEPLINRLVGIAIRKKLIPDPPKSIQGRSFRPVWTSPLARKQEERVADSIMKAATMIGQISQLFATPTPLLERFDFDALSKVIADVYNVPQSIVKDDATIKAEREKVQQAQAEQQKQQQMMQMMQQGAAIESQTANTNGPVNKIMKGLNEQI